MGLSNEGAIELAAYINFPVPAERVPEVAIFLYGSEEAMPEGQKAITPISEEQREELLIRIYEESEPRFRRLLLLLADREDPAAPMSYEDVTSAMGWTSPRSLPGALGAFGRRTKHRYGGFWPFDREHDAEQNWSLAMQASVADFVVELHVRRGLPAE
jgi:hypothetical protein